MRNEVGYSVAYRRNPVRSAICWRARNRPNRRVWGVTPTFPLEERDCCYPEINPKVAIPTHISNLASGENLHYTHPRPTCGTTMSAPTRLLLRRSLLGWSDHAKVTLTM
uniref:Uncharacterized protein n=1 Tax=Ananas comosus var. bracteatus TaxID=296719 RepID=A0A6V7NEU0_ANACO|nr:unnamed protein product [Ananas comosus var. bracteatus]